MHVPHTPAPSQLFSPAQPTQGLHDPMTQQAMQCIFMGLMQMCFLQMSLLQSMANAMKPGSNSSSPFEDDASALPFQDDAFAAPRPAGKGEGAKKSGGLDFRSGGCMEGVAAGAPSGVPGSRGTVPMPEDKPTDPSMTVDDYLNANNGLLKNAGNQEGQLDRLKDFYGDWNDKSRSLSERRQSACNAAEFLGVIKHKKNRNGGDRGDVVNDGKIHGSTHTGQIRPGTEHAVWKDALKGSTREEQRANVIKHLSGPNLAKTKDRYVRTDGTTRSDSAVNSEKAGEALVWIPGLSNVLKGAGRADRDHAVGADQVILGAFGGVGKTYENNFKGLENAVLKGRVNPAGLVTEMYKENLKDGITDNITDGIVGQ